MVKTRIAGALMAVVLMSCSVEEPEQSTRLPQAPLADPAEGKPEAVDRTGSDDSQAIPVTTDTPIAFENAGLRDDFNGP